MVVGTLLKHISPRRLSFPPSFPPLNADCLWELKLILNSLGIRSLACTYRVEGTLASSYLTSAPAILANYDRTTNQPTIRPTNSPTNRPTDRPTN